jgi:hypothetical protein
MNYHDKDEERSADAADFAEVKDHLKRREVRTAQSVFTSSHLRNLRHLRIAPTHTLKIPTARA